MLFLKVIDFPLTSEKELANIEQTHYIEVRRQN